MGFEDVYIYNISDIDTASSRIGVRLVYHFIRKLNILVVRKKVLLLDKETKI